MCDCCTNKNIEPVKDSNLAIPVDHVSETAWLVAACRIPESQRADGYFNDFLASKLLGDKWEKIKDIHSHWKYGEWMMTIRTTLIDRLISRLTNENSGLGKKQDGSKFEINTVINLAAGLDTRPYRLDLPANLRWIEVDLEGMIEHKNQCLQDYRTKCHLERMAIDLSKEDERRAFFTKENVAKWGNTLIITEGLLGYLDLEDVIWLSSTLRSLTNIKAWIMDIGTKASFLEFRRISAGSTDTSLMDKKSPSGNQVFFKFLPEEGVKFFEPHGWKIEDFKNFYESGKDLKRDFPDEEIIDNNSRAKLSEQGIGLLV